MTSTTVNEEGILANDNAHESLTSGASLVGIILWHLFSSESRSLSFCCWSSMIWFFNWQHSSLRPWQHAINIHNRRHYNYRYTITFVKDRRCYSIWYATSVSGIGHGRFLSCTNLSGAVSRIAPGIMLEQERIRVAGKSAEVVFRTSVLIQLRWSSTDQCRPCERKKNVVP